ncbi:MAG: LCP family protein [Buchananella hordeovulneris]|nr:LCP family protein [Buchananella hordeovulneris]
MSVKYQSRHALHKRRKRRIFGPTVLAVVLFVGTGSWFALNDLNRADIVDISTILGPSRPAPVPVPGGQQNPGDVYSGRGLNILVIGSDYRSSDQPDAEEVEGMRGDTTMFMHISADRSRVEVVSIPRDMLVDIPECYFFDGSSSGADYGQFNAAFSIGARNLNIGEAAACTIRTVEQMSDVSVNEWVVVEFNSFQQIVDSLGGIPMCFSERLRDKRSDLSIEPGCQRLTGKQALSYSRARYELGDGSDLSRINRQQQLVGSIAETALGANMLTDLPKLYNFLGTSLDSLTSSEIGQITTLAGLAHSLSGIDRDKIRFLTLPVELAADGSRVVPTYGAQELWEAIRMDTPIPDYLGGTSSTGAPWPDSSQTSTVDASESTADATETSEVESEEPSNE